MPETTVHAEKVNGELLLRALSRALRHMAEATNPDKELLEDMTFLRGLRDDVRSKSPPDDTDDTDETSTRLDMLRAVGFTDEQITLTDELTAHISSRTGLSSREIIAMGAAVYEAKMRRSGLDVEEVTTALHAASSRGDLAAVTRIIERVKRVTDLVEG